MAAANAVCIKSAAERCFGFGFVFWFILLSVRFNIRGSS